MGKLNFRRASDNQLKEIAFNDMEACWADKVAAEVELMRRNSPKCNKRINYKQISVYPR